jgi:hypothetical protein
VLVSVLSRCLSLSLSGLGLVHVHFGLGGRGLVGVGRS